jgi:D-arabinose 1-dehydrogenase-like Zn-dependent alcohol dehydrogenase
LQGRTFEEPACPADGVIVKAMACGVCRSDWHGWKGEEPDVKAPRVPGHEFAGLVEAVGPLHRESIDVARAELLLRRHALRLGGRAQGLSK